MATFIRWSPFRESEAFDRAVSRVFEENRRPATQQRATTPRREAAPLTYALPLDVYETEKAFVVTANVPGLKQEQIQVNFEDGVLTIVAEVAESELGEGTRTLVRERAHGRFARSIRLADSVDTNNVEAVYDNGVLTLNLPKTPESQPKQIQVKFNSPLLDSQN